jgi:tetratricopeptide (TPR) repeat protein
VTLPDIPYNISYSFDQDLRDVPEAPGDMARAVDFLQAQLASGEMSERDQARLLGQKGVLCRMLLRLEEAEEYCERAVAICRQLGDARCEFVNSIRLAHVYQWQGRFNESDSLFLWTLELCERGPDLAGYLDFACQHYGKSLFDQGQYAQAIEMFERALEIREKKGDAALVESSRIALQTARARALQSSH